MERAWITKYDFALKESIKQAKQVPVLINYTVSGSKDRYEKTPDEHDLALIDKIDAKEIPYWCPIDPLPDGCNTRQPKGSHGIIYSHQFFTKRNLWVLSALYALASRNTALIVILDGFSVTTMMSRFRVPAWINKTTGPMKGWTNGLLYVPSVQGEQSWLNVFNEKQKMISRALRKQEVLIGLKNTTLSISSLSEVKCSDNSIDYIFLDPPFGANINYSELSYLWETWIRVFTNNTKEAIENSVQEKGASEYRALMTTCFKEAHRILKPGRWMTVEFSNTKASVWNNIQAALTEAGFIVANVSALDKKQGSFKAVTTPTAVKQDLVISAYKPNGGFEDRFVKEAEGEEGVWDFVRTHLGYLPVVKKQGLQIATVPERDPRILFDQMISYYVRRGYDVPLSSQEFQLGLKNRFAERDGMYFLHSQVVEYDRKKMLSGGINKQTELFVKDESTAIDWLRNLLKDKPQTSGDINHKFMQEISGWGKNETPLELSLLLEQNFLRYDGKGRIPEQIHAYLSSNWKDMRKLQKDDPVLINKAKNRWYVPDPNKASDLEQFREKSLLRVFWEYLPQGYKPSTTTSTDAFLPGLELQSGKVPKGKRLKVIRLEAVRVGFKHCWQNRDYRTIIAVAKRIPETVLQEDPKLLMWYDQAITRVGEE